MIGDAGFSNVTSIEPESRARESLTMKPAGGSADGPGRLPLLRLRPVLQKVPIRPSRIRPPFRHQPATWLPSRKPLQMTLGLDWVWERSSKWMAYRLCSNLGLRSMSPAVVVVMMMLSTGTRRSAEMPLLATAW